MVKLWILAAFIAVLGHCYGSQAQFVEDEWNQGLESLQDFQSKYEDGIPDDSFPSSDEILKSLDDDLSNYDEALVLSDNVKDKAIEHEIANLRESLENAHSEAKVYDWPADDYQYEDNRSDEDLIVNNNDFRNEDDTIKDDSAGSIEKQEGNQAIENRNNYEANNQVHTNIGNNDNFNESGEKKSGIESEPIPENLDNEPSKDIIQDTRQILEQNSDVFETQKSHENNEKSEDIDQGNEPSDEIIEETKSILKDAINGGFEEDDEVVQEVPIETDFSAFEEIDWGNIHNWDTINFGEPKDSNEVENINLGQVADEVSKEIKNENASKELENMDISENAEELNSVEETVDQVYADLRDDLDRLFETWDKLSSDDIKEKETQENFDDSIDVLEYDKKYDIPYGEKEVLKLREDDFDSNIEDIFNEKQNNSNFKEENESNDNETQLINNDIVLERSQSFMISSENPDKEISTRKSIDVGDLSPSQYDDLMKQFVASHEDELDTYSDNFDIHVASIHIDLTTEEATVVTSPNYPSAYPTNNVVDWIFEGEGMGLEFNLTDFEVNGNIGDYLLVKPGGMDAPSDDGLVFTYHLNQPRPYRFLNVNKLFVRFESHVGLTFQRGFSFTVRMVEPTQKAPEDVPYPEPLLPDPLSTYTVNLGVTSAEVFLNQTEDFRRLIADMASMYINANDIDMGLNTTTQITQVTRITVCNINWPNYEECVQVKFAVPLIHEEESGRLTEEDLEDMWNTYVDKDPFATRLRVMGITEFAQTDNGQVLMVWLVIAAGVVISVAMLAFALWRFSCYEDYTKMAPYNDTDSVTNKKRSLNLYPTPHQTLPSLYSEDYKWADQRDDSSRVDMGGFANKSFVRDELFNIDSDEEIIGTKRERGPTTPRDNYQV